MNMIEAIKFLENQEDGYKLLCKFRKGCPMVLADFETIDETIYDYDSTDLILADVIEIRKTEYTSFSVGNKIEFSLIDVVSFEDLKSGVVYLLNFSDHK